MKTMETARLLLRPFEADDAHGMFALDSNANVHTFLGKRPVKSMDEVADVIAFIQKQYEENGIGRWAVIEKATNEFVGWSGLKRQANVTGAQPITTLGTDFKRNSGEEDSRPKPEKPGSHTDSNK